MSNAKFLARRMGGGGRQRGSGIQILAMQCHVNLKVREATILWGTKAPPKSARPSAPN